MESITNKEDELLSQISVIIPIYNQEKFISRCLDSVEEQDYPKDNIEIIIVDDGSTDNSINIASKYGVKIICQDHKGPGAARNKGVEEASSNIIAFLDSDDIAYTTWLKESIYYLNIHKNENFAAVGCSHNLLNSENDFIKLAWLEHLFRYTHIAETVSHLGTSGSLFKKSTIIEVGGFDISLRTAEDMDLSTKILNAGYKLHLITTPLIKVGYANDLFQYYRKQILNVAYMVVFYFKKNGMRSRKSSYSGNTEYIQGLLPLLFISISAIIHNNWILIALGLWIMFLVILNGPFLIFISSKKHEINLNKTWPLIVIPYLWGRSIAWCIGLLFGVILVLKRFLKFKIYPLFLEI